MWLCPVKWHEVRRKWKQSGGYTNSLHFFILLIDNVLTCDFAQKVEVRSLFIKFFRGNVLVGLSLLELIQLTEAVAIDDLLQIAVGVMANIAAVAKEHEFAILGGVWLPGREPFDIRITGMGKLCPSIAHEVGEAKVVVGGLGHDVAGLMQAIEAEAELVAVYRTHADG